MFNEVFKQQIIYNEGPPHLNWKVLTVKVRKCYYPYKQHPDVLNKKAFWHDSKTLIVGYSLNNNPDVFRPIWQRDNETLKKRMRIDIRKYAKFTAAIFREILVKKTLMKDETFNKFPEDVINHIARYTYDPLLYCFPKSDRHRR